MAPDVPPGLALEGGQSNVHPWCMTPVVGQSNLGLPSYSFCSTFLFIISFYSIFLLIICLLSFSLFQDIVVFSSCRFSVVHVVLLHWMLRLLSSLAPFVRETRLAMWLSDHWDQAGHVAEWPLRQASVHCWEEENLHLTFCFMLLLIQSAFM